MMALEARLSMALIAQRWQIDPISTSTLLPMKQVPTRQRLVAHS
jgi:hypothetical protein